MKEISLDKLPILKNGTIKKIIATEKEKNRFLDLGFTLGTKVKAVLLDYSNTLKAYEVKGAVIALRCKDSSKILVEVKN